MSPEKQMYSVLRVNQERKRRGFHAEGTACVKHVARQWKGPQCGSQAFKIWNLFCLGHEPLSLF